MDTPNSLQDIHEGWNGYHQSIVNAVKQLTPEQLRWRPAENFNSVGELVRHSDGNSDIVETSSPVLPWVKNPHRVNA
jgi:Protein of unknown function (DUF1572)